MAGEPGTFDNVIEFRSPRAREEFSAYVAMLIFLGSWVMMFSGLFMAYELLKARADGVFAGLSKAPGCELLIEHFDGGYGWPEYDDRGNENVA